MDLSIGLPNTLDVPGPFLLEWARRAEERGFTALATIDRIVYPSFDSLTALAAAAGATSRIGLLSGVLLAPLYPPVWLAKATASLDSLSGGRLTLGLGVGGREDDFLAVGRSRDGRGALMDEALDVLARSWAGENVTGGEFPLGPPPAGGSAVPVLIGGNSEAAVRRTVQYGDGWIAGGGGPEAAAPMIAKVRAAWRDAGREGEPRIAALAYFGLGDPDASRAALRSYYGFLDGGVPGEGTEQVVAGALHTPEEIRGAVKNYADVGVTELVLDPTVAALDEVERLADIVF
jgi:alkanesulfonate monooxygenase SsuD/methylene tetrahydromethanopterin reductase-like flavin-dependent oxidoreductase (luciferase family)